MLIAFQKIAREMNGKTQVVYSPLELLEMIPIPFSASLKDLATQNVFPGDYSKTPSFLARFAWQNYATIEDKTQGIVQHFRLSLRSSSLL